MNLVPLTISLCSCFLYIVGCNPFLEKHITKINADTYKISRAGTDSLVMRQQLWKEADFFCQKKKKYFMPVEKNYNQTHYEMQFRCLNAGDPELLEEATRYQNKRYHKKLGGYGEVQY